MWRLVAPVWVLILTAVVSVQSSSPVITDFLTKDLVNPEDVKFNNEEAFKLPCKATGSNLKWSWKHNDKYIAHYNGYPYTLSDDGTLIGDYLRDTASGTYQCFVKDEKTGAVVFSRKLKVAVTVVGKFINPTNVVVKVNLGDPFKYDCPPRKHSYGVGFSWGNSENTAHYTFPRNERRSISSNGTLYIMYVTQQDIDEIEGYKGIRCTISGANSFQRSGTLRLEKIDKTQTDSENFTLPTWSATPNAQEVAVEGKNKSLYCFASGRPPPAITWKKDGQTIVDNQGSYKISRSFFGRLLFIQNINKSVHEGVYTCEASNDFNTENQLSFDTENQLSFDTTLEVKVPPKWATNPPPKNISIVIENNGTLECRVTADPAPVITWHKNGEQLQPSEHRKLDGGKLQLINTTMEDVGVYQCAAENEHGMIISSTFIDVLAWKPSFANVQFGPFHLLNEKEARLPCQPSTAAPRPTIQWFREEELINYNENSRYQLEEDGTLVIKQVDKNQDAVKYTCNALNFKGEATVSAVVNVLVLPKLTSKPENQTVMEGAMVTLHCNATGNPIPKITWTKDGKTVTTGDILKFETQRRDTGKYVCTAENGLNISVNASATIDVLYEPSLTTTPSNQTVMEGAKTTFRCTATGNPTAKIQWTKDGKTLSTGETLTLAPNRTNSGKYWCSADNGLSLPINASAYLDVQYPPSLIMTPSDQTVIENQEVNFFCTASGSPVPEIVWIKDGNIEGQGDTLSFQANREHSGKYWCSADNGLSVAVNASAELNVLFPPSLTSSPNNQTILEGANAIFVCKATSNPVSKITWTKDGKTVGEGDTLSFVTDRNQSGEYWCSAENGLNSTANGSAMLDVQFPPSLVTQPSDKTVIENEQVTLRCSAIGNPVPEITWIKDGRTIESGETLSFEAHRDHSGKYWCSADNSLKRSVNASAVLNVQFAPSLTLRPNDETIIEGRTVTFYCKATGNPTPNITWTKDGKTVGEGDTLRFVTHRNQSGEYWCSAANGLNSTVNARAHLNVQYPPSLTGQPSDQTIIENEDATLHCSAIGNPVPKITWIKDGKTLEAGETLSFKALRDQSGKYWCSADNGLGDAVNSSADIDVQFPPSLTSSPNDQTVIEGAMATFRCTAKGNPAPKITWTKDGKTIVTGETLSFVTHRNNSGEYWCSADNGLNPTVNASANLDVQFAASLTSKPTNQMLMENKEVTFHCSAIGNPVPTITWLKDGKTVGLEETLRFVANRSHSGKYWCLVKNDLIVTLNASANLDVQFAPSFISKPTDQTIIEGSMAQFNCSATGNPTPKITWSKDRKTVAIGEMLSFEALRDHSGKYLCTVENGLNTTANASVNLDVQFPPSLIIKPSDQTLTENREVTLRCTAVGNPSPKITWVKDGLILAEEETLSLKVSRDESGVYWCSADNGLSAAVNASAELNVQFVPSLISKPKDKTVIEGASVTFHCNSTGNPPAKITWIKDGKTVAKGNMLVFETNRTQSGEYWCSADNGLNSTVNASANLDVHFPPSLAMKPSDKTLIENEEVTFHCAAIGNPVPKITWIKDGQTVGSEDTLRFTANRSHSGKYWCLAKNYFNVTVNASVNLDVQFAPDLISTPTDQTVTERAKATFHCKATGNPTPNITWSEDGKTVATGETLSFEVSRNQSGKYWCIAENGFNTTANASVNLNVQFAPSLTTKPSDQTLTENEEAKLRCAAIGNPTPKITWTKKGVFITEGELLDFKANRHHSGKYWCSADNGLGVTVNASADLNVQFAPSLSSGPKDQTIIERATVTFHCNATGNPTPKITWTKDGKTVGEGIILSFVTDRNQSGKYRCSADNGLNSTVNASAHLDVQYPPSLTTTPSDQTVIENEDVTFYCTATGNPVPGMVWIKDGNVVDQGDTLSLQANREHSGTYWCSADNGLSVAVNASAELNVQFAPSFISKPTDQTIIEGSMAQFNCSATGNPTPKITWSKDGKTVAIGEMLSFEALRNHSGKYLCTVENGLNTTANASVNLDVQFPPSLIIKPSDQTLTENREVTLRCTAVGNPSPKITWVKDGLILAEEETLSLKVSRDGSGVYWCSADNGLSAAVNASAELNVQFVPSLISKPKDKTVIEGASVTFHCNSTGNPPAKITWIKDGKTVAKGNMLVFETNRTQSGEYWCSADNGLNSTVNASASLYVHFPPSLVMKPSDKTLIENEEVTFHCAAIGNPVPKITWIKDGKTVGSEETLRFIANRSHSGKYWCLAKNYLNVTVNASANLDVQFAPDLILTPTDQTVTEDAKATFHCKATGNPTPNITWSKDGKTVATGETLSFEVSRNQSGKYWCIAENGFNTTANASVNLNVQFAPSLTTKPSDQTLIENEEAKLRCAAIGNPTPKITWTKKGVFITEGELLDFKANRHHSGKYWCSANNGLGVAVNASADLNVQFAPSLSSRPKDQTIIERATVTFHCNATGNPTPKITWTKDGKTVGEGIILSFVTDRNQSGKYWCSADNGLNSTVNASADLDVQYPPSLTTTPSDQTVIENEDVTFYCTVTGNPVPEMVWIKDGNVVDQGDTLSLQANREHSGTYWCSADNGLSVAVNASAELNVQYPPSFISIPSDQIAHERDQISLICRATGNPVPDIKWRKDGKTVVTGETLSFEALRNRSGIYWCSAENGLYAINTSVSLDVQFSPSFYMQPTNNTVTEGTTVTFFCNATGNPAPKIRWIKDGKTVGEENALTFIAKRNHSGKYWCSAENEFNATVQAIAYLNVQFAPSLTTEPKNHTIIEGGIVTFHCNATGNPTPNITWTKDGKTVGKGDTLSFVTDRTQSGKYWCSADNGLNSTVHARANLDVQFPPSFTKKPSDQTVIENEQLTLHCTATGNPVPNITWIKDNKTMGFGDSLSFGVQKQDSGTYWCFANNGLTETIHATAEVDVQYPPTLIVSSIDQSILEGTNVIFVCYATGNPTPVITWIKDGKPVANGDILNFVANRNQSGKYWCSAENGLSPTVNASADLDVKFPPSLTTKPSDQIITENGEVTFHCTAIGNPLPNITWIKDKETVGQGDTLSIEALREHSGKYWCSADNGLNIIANASANLEVKFPPSLITSPADLTVLEATLATFYCNATGNPTPKITWTKDGKTVGEGDTLRFATDRNQSGEYWCSADNGLNLIANASAKLDVQYFPIFTASPIDQIINEAAMASFYCEATGNPTPKITWSKDGKTLATGTVLSFETNRNQSGKYWCSADNGLGKVVNASATLDVQYNASLTRRPSNQTIVEADNATFQCTATGNPAPTITWFKDGKTVGTGETLNFEALRNNSGEYWCVADNRLNSTVNASAFLDVQYLPDLITKAVNQTVNETDQVTFLCAAIGNPVPKITWFKNGNAVGSGSQLSFTALRNHSGKYWCLANNGLNATVNAIAYLNVQFPPSFTKLPNDRTVTEADDTTFHCTAIGNPVPVITWTKDGKTVGKGTILNLKASRNKTGEYWCWADNGLSKAVKAGSHLDVLYPPSLTTTPADQTLKEKSTVIFHCAAMGNPVPKITWNKNGVTIGTGNTLRFKAERKDSGKYWCLSDNGFNKTVNASASLDVLFPPSFINMPSDQIVHEKEQTTLTCTVTGNPVPNITWSKDGEVVGAGATLSFEALRNRSGVYWCTAENGLDAINASVSLDVQFSPSFYIQPTNKTVTEGGTATFFCNATGNPAPKIRWIKDGKTVGEKNTLTFVANRNHSGKYWCSAENNFNATVQAIAYLDVQFPPSFTTIPTKQTVKENNEATFHCVATGNPSPKITWYRNGKTVATGNTLKIMAANRNESGNYWCFAENGVGLDINASVHLDVQFPPTLVKGPVDQTVTEGATVSLHCNATGKPAPKITWTKDGNSLATGDKLSFETNRNQSGTYWCSADNGINPSYNTSAVLDIQYPTSLALTPTDQTVKEGEETTLRCTAIGNPTPNITWIKAGKTVASGDTLRFSATRNDSGKYWCSAENGLGLSVNASASLNVQFPPDVTITSTYLAVVESAIATFHCTAVGNPLPAITWTKDGKTVGAGEILSFEVFRNQSGTYWCSAENVFNKTAKASGYLDVHFKPERTRLTVKPDITINVQFDSFVKLNCTTYSRPDPDGYKFYRDQELLGSNSSGMYHLQLQRSGVYACVPYNSAGDGEKAFLNIQVNAWKPSFDLVTFGPFYLFKGSQVRLPCKPFAEPYPTFTWFKDGEAISYGQNESYSLDVDGSLIIDKVKDKDSGKYTCMAENYLGKANATADGILLERTQIVVRPQNQTVSEGESANLRCKATADPSLELIYMWKRDGADISGDSNIQWLEEGNVLKLSDITFEETGVYTCVAYTPEPRGSEDTASALVSISGVPSPPSHLQLTDCYNRRTNISWSPVISNDTQITNFLIEQESNHEPNVFKLVYNVTNPNTSSVSLNIPGWSTLRFRVRAVNSAGPSRPSVTTPKGTCTTPVGVPKKYPSNLRGVSLKANELFISWDPVPKTEWDAPGFYYILKYRRVNLGYLSDWKEEKIGDPSVIMFGVTNAGYYQRWEFKIRTGNHEGLGPESPIKRSFSGQNAPAAKPESTEVGSVTANSVSIAWRPVTVKKGSVDGYKIYYWGESRAVSSRRRRETIPSDANVITVTGGKTQQATITGLKPYTNYQVVVKAFNTGGEGPASAVMIVETLEGEPGPPSDVEVYPFGEFILVTWKPPKEPNGIITNYQVGSADYNGLSPENVPVAMETVRPNVFKKLLGNVTFERRYVVVVRAQTSKGWGESARETTTTIKRLAPAKPDKPTVVETGKDVITLMYNYGVGGGWTREFKVLYRKQEEGGEFQETDWVDHFSTAFININNLEPEVYEFKSVGKNSVGTSPESDVIEARPQPEPVVSGQRGGAPVYRKDWFITLIILSAATLLLLIIVLVHRRWKRRRSSNFKVTEHEKEMEKEEKEQGVPVDIKPRETWRMRLEDTIEEASQDSLDEYGGDTAYFAEDGSFVGDLKQGRNRDSVYDEIPLDDDPAVV